jgi:hypothetical protein
LKSDEQEKLIGHFKGLIITLRTTLKKKVRGLDLAGKVGKRLGNSQIQDIQNRLSGLLIETTDEKGETTCSFDKLFSLDFEESTPTEYQFIYPHPQTLFGMGEISKTLRNYKVSTDFEDKSTMKGILKEAGLMEITESIEIGLVER